MAKKKIKVKKGDVFSIKINPQTFAYGQVVEIGLTCDSLIVYDIISEVHPQISEVVKRKVIFFINTVTNKIENGEWEIIGNENVPKHLIFPLYLSETTNGGIVLSQDGEFLRYANEADYVKLKPLSSYTPNVLEDAVKARFGDGEWYDELDNLIYYK